MEELKGKLLAAGIDVTTFAPVASPPGQQYYSVEIGRDARAAWQKARTTLNDLGWYPLLTGKPNQLEKVSAFWTSSDTYVQTNFDPALEGRKKFIELCIVALEGLDQREIDSAIMSVQFTDPASVLQVLQKLNPEGASQIRKELETTLASLSGENLDSMMGAVTGARRGHLERAQRMVREQAVRKIECPGKAPVTVADFIEIGEHIDPFEWIEKRRASDTEYYSCEEGNWPNLTSQVISKTLSASQKLFSLRRGATLMLLIPAKHPWHVPAYTQFGDWNDSPVPQVHVALSKHWYEKFGAQIVEITHDSLEMFVSKPISDRTDAMEVAQQQFIYNADLVHTSDSTLATLAFSLLNSSVWTFWWD